MHTPKNKTFIYIYLSGKRMFKKLLSLDEERKDKIINAGLKEFASKTYEEASTNNIAKESGISKALMFHYVHTKKDFFIFLLDYCFKHIKKNYIDLIDYSERDLFERIKKLTYLKVDVIKHHPLIFEFMKNAFLLQDKELKLEVDKRKKKIELNVIKRIFYENVDDSMFRKNLDISKSKELIHFMLEGYSTKLRDSVPSDFLKFNFKNMMIDFDEYVEEMKKIFYK